MQFHHLQRFCSGGLHVQPGLSQFLAAIRNRAPGYFRPRGISCTVITALPTQATFLAFFARHHLSAHVEEESGHKERERELGGVHIAPVRTQPAPSDSQHIVYWFAGENAQKCTENARKLRGSSPALKCRHTKIYFFYLQETGKLDQ